MVVCKCRKATKLYCFVHKTPVCFDCMCSPDHAHCVVWQYSDWVNDGDYDWPQHCAVCKESLEDSNKPTIRLGCLHVPHSDCLRQHLESFPAHTAPAGFTCPTQGCNLELWPARNPKEAATTLYTNLRSLISQTSVAGKILSAIVAPAPALPNSTAAAQAASGLPTINGSMSQGGSIGEIVPAPDAVVTPPVVKADGRNGYEYPPASAAAAASVVSTLPPQIPQTARMPPAQVPSSVANVNVTRSRVGHVDRTPAADVAVEMDGGHYQTDEEGGDKKYARRERGTQGGWLQQLNPFTPPARLPVSRRGDEDSADAARGLRRGKGQRRGLFSDPRKLLLAIAVVSCMATMFLLYFRLAQNIASAGDSGTFIPEG